MKESKVDSGISNITTGAEKSLQRKCILKRVFSRNLGFPCDSAGIMRRYIPSQIRPLWIVTSATLIVAAGPYSAANAQTTPPQLPRIEFVDKNQVDLVSGSIRLPELGIDIGNDQSSLRVSRYSERLNDFTSLSSTFYLRYIPQGGNGGVLVADVGVGRWRNFVMGTATGSSTNYTAHPAPGPYYEQGNGPAILACTGNYQQLYANGVCSLYEEDGTKIDFQMPSQILTTGGIIQVNGVASAITKADGEVITLQYVSGALRSVKSSLGFAAAIKFTSGIGITEITAGNLSDAYCDVPHLNCTLNAATSVNSFDANGTTLSKNGQAIYTRSNNQPNGSYGWSFNETRPGGVVTSYVKSNTYPDVEFTATRGNTINYKITGTGVRQIVSTNPGGSKKWFGVDTVFDHLLWSQDELGRSTLYTHFEPGAFGGSSRLKRVYRPDSPNISSLNGYPFPGGPEPHKGYTEYSYTRGILSRVTVVPTDSSSNQIVDIGIAASCTIAQAKVCNKPTYIRDARNNQTDFTYDPAHGGVLTETFPADANGVRPQKRYSYAQLSPKIMNASGVLVNSTPVWRLTRISECQSATVANPASCVGTAAEKVTTFAYNSNNLFRTAETVANGDGSLSATTTYAYDIVGNVVSVDGPRSDVDDRRYTTYDTLRRPVFEIGADPDGAGGNPRQVTKHNYDAAGREYLTEFGTGNATNGSDFVRQRFERMSFDPTTGDVVKKEVGYP